jgi:hypothetical protein
MLTARMALVVVRCGLAGDWRAAHPKLVTWLDRFAAKVPAFAETKVAA